MEKIGILTNWGVPNYGTFLQAYAMQKVIQQMCPEAVVSQIAYLNKQHYDMYYSLFDVKYRMFIINPRTYINMLKKIRIRKLGLPFQKYYEHIPSVTLLENGEKQFDLVVLGSDIMWAYTMAHNRDDEKLFGIGLGAERIISYAPSCGSAARETEIPSYVAAGLKNMAAISVRDERSADFVQRITGRRPEVVLDPTFLWDFEADENVVEPSVTEEYLLVYGSFFSEELVNGAVNYAKQNGLTIICLDSLGDKFDWCDRIIRMRELSPFEWVGYFKKASTIMTCTFHGLMFSFILKKPVVFQPTQFVMDKVDDLIEKLDLKEVLLEKQTFAEKQCYDWNYSLINQKLAPLREASLRYLGEALLYGRQEA